MKIENFQEKKPSPAWRGWTGQSPGRVWRGPLKYSAGPGHMAKSSRSRRGRCPHRPEGPVTGRLVFPYVPTVTARQVPGRCGHRPLRGAYEFAEGLLVLLLHAATPQALRASFPVSEQHQQCSADDSNKAGSRFFRQLFVEHAPREQNRHQNAQLIDGRDDARRAVLQGFIIAQPAAARG